MLNCKVVTLLAIIKTVDIVPLENCFITNKFIGISQITNNNIFIQVLSIITHISAFLVFMAVNKAKPYFVVISIMSWTEK